MAELLPPALLLAGALLACGLAPWRRARLAEAAVAAAATLALAVLFAAEPLDALLAGWFGLPPPFELAGAGHDLGTALAGLILLVLLSGSATRVLDVAPASAPVAAAGALTGAAALAAVTTTVPTGLYAVASLAALTGWLTAALDPGSGRAGVRGAGRYALFCLVADLAMLAAWVLGERAGPLLPGSLALAGVARLRLFPFHGATDLARLTGRGHAMAAGFGGIVGVAMLSQAVVRASPGDQPGIDPATVLLAAALLTAASAALALALARSYRAVLELGGSVDAAHVAAALAVGTPLALAAGLLYAMAAFGGRALLLLLADAAAPGGQQRRRLPGRLALLPFGTGFGSLAGMPPLPGFVARWLVYLALFEGGAWPVPFLLAVAAGTSLTEMLRRAAAFEAPAGSIDLGRRLATGLAPLWLPLALVAVTPIALLRGPLAAAVAALRPGQDWSLGVDVLLSVPGVFALLLALVLVVTGLGLYAERELGPLRRPVDLLRRLTRGAIWQGMREVALIGTRWGWLALFGELLGGVVRTLLMPWEERFVAIGLVATIFVIVLVALG